MWVCKWTHPQTVHHCCHFSIYAYGAVCVPWLLPPGMQVNIVRYLDMKCHNISISWLGYNINPRIPPLIRGRHLFETQHLLEVLQYQTLSSVHSRLLMYTRISVCKSVVHHVRAGQLARPNPRHSAQCACRMVFSEKQALEHGACELNYHSENC